MISEVFCRARFYSNENVMFLLNYFCGNLNKIDLSLDRSLLLPTCSPRPMHDNKKCSFIPLVHLFLTFLCFSCLHYSMLQGF